MATRLNKHVQKHRMRAETVFEESVIGEKSVIPRQMVEANRATASIELKGVGYRVRSTEVEGVTVLRFQVGTSHSLAYKVPQWVQVTIDSSSTKRTLSVKSEGMGMGASTPLDGKQALGNVVEQILRLRPRSPYTGNGILLAGKHYPALKSTKAAKK